MDLIADTSFLVGLWRGQDWAVDFARQNPDKALGIPWIVMGEFWHGSIRAGHDRKLTEEFLMIGQPLFETQQTIHRYAEICCQVQSGGFWKEIGQNDLWIAATSLSQDKPLITKNGRHFKKIEGLKLICLNQD